MRLSRVGPPDYGEKVAARGTTIVPMLPGSHDAFDRPHPDPRGSVWRFPRSAAFAIIALASIGMAGYALVAYSTRPIGSLVHPKMQEAPEANRLATYGQIFGAVFAVALGPTQVLSSLRRR